MSTEFNPTAYAYRFTNTDAGEYAQEAYERGDLTDPDEWAHETADGMAAVIYTGQALALYCAGITGGEDDNGYRSGADDASGVIDDLVVYLSYAWHRRILEAAALEVLEEVSA